MNGSNDVSTGLRLLLHTVEHVGFGDATSFERGRLTVSRNEMAQLMTAEPALEAVELSWASPGESARIIKVLDAVQPRTKGRGGAGIFPGLLGA
ncbi:MAG TPA: glycine/sarcosine/betaine reductase component B subunit, partial [Candidatus Sulfotelmatobacter sp.]|nr:glycine/sarcosine/betaine reductase component B subunit [Candidatus Sulfotelmatobacter sp.]